MLSKIRFASVAWFAAPPLLLCIVASACSSSTQKGAKGESQGEWQGESRDTTITHEACDPAGHDARTFKGDSTLASGKSFVTRVYEGGREICSFADLNGDGNIDVFTYMGPDGRIRRREAAYTVSKAIDEIAIYEGGELKVVMRETNFDGKLDTWDYYEGGKLVRRERDKTGDGRIDEWWTFQPGTDNATIVQADTRTGKPDPAQTLTIGVGAGGLPGGVGAAKPTASVSAKPDAGPETGLSPLPTETTTPDAAAPSTASSADAGADSGKKKGK